MSTRQAHCPIDRRHLPFLLSATELPLLTSVRTDHNRVAKADRLAVDTPDGTGGVEFANEIEGFALGAGVEVTLLQIGAGAAPGAAQTTPAPIAAGAPNPNGGPTPQTGESAQASAEARWLKTSYACSLTGSFEGLMNFAAALESSQRIVDITLVSARRRAVDAQSGAPNLELKLAGTLYGLQENR